MFCKCRNRCILSHLNLVSKKEGHGRFQPPLLRNIDHAVPSSSSVVLGKAAQEIISVLPSFCNQLQWVCLSKVSGLPENCEAEKLRSCPFGCWIRALSESTHSCAKRMHVVVQQCLGKKGFRACPNHAASICSLLLAEAA